MQNRIKSVLTFVAVAALVLSVANLSLAASVSFTGGAQTLNGSVSADGSAQTNMSSNDFLGTGFPVVSDPDPQSFTVSLDPATSVFASTPTGSGDVSFSNPSTLTAINSLNLDLLNGSKLNVKVATITLNFLADTGTYDGNGDFVSEDLDGIYDTPIPIDLNIGAVINSLLFSQTSGSVGAGTFSSTGDISGLFDASINFGGFPFDLTGESFNSSTTISGTQSLTPVGGGQSKLVLDGTATLPVPIDQVITLDTLGLNTPGDLGLLGTVALLASINVNVAVHLESLVAIPEPGTVVLMGLGVLGLVPLARRKFKK